MCYTNSEQKDGVKCKNQKYNKIYLLQLYVLLFYANGL